MKKKFQSVSALTLALLMLFTTCAFAGEQAGKDYTIESPYADVVWDGEGAWGAYKGNLHTHSYVSDATVDYKTMILEYYNQGYSFLAMTDHGVTGKPWNERPTILPLYAYQYLIGNVTTYFTDDEYAAILNGNYPVNGEKRGYGMLDVTGGNELNALTITKDHVNGIFLPEHVGDNYLGYENDFEGAVKLVDEAGGLSFINHPGDFIDENDDPDACNNPEYINYFSDILLRYDSCLGMEVFNEHNGTTPTDRILWDNLLMACLPYGKNVIAYSNGDTHDLRDVDASYMVFMMPENSIENIKETMQNGAFFSVTRVLRKNDKFGPATDLSVANTDKAIPMFKNITVDGHKVSVTVTDTYNIQWVGNGEIIAQTDIQQTADGYTYTIDLDTVENAEDLLYIRCQLLGEGGITLSQAFVIDNGSEPEKYEKDTSPQAMLKEFVRKILSLRIFVLFDEIIKAIKYR